MTSTDDAQSPDVSEELPADQRPDIVELLTLDHGRIRELIESADRDALIRELSQHLVAEAQLVYPELRQAANDADDVIDACLYGDHHLEKALAQLDHGHDEALPRVGELFAGHVQALEEDVFTRMREMMDVERRVALGEALGDVISGAPTHPHPRTPDEGALEVFADIMAAEFDSLRDFYRRRRNK